jgi:hypothetical protein
MKCTLPEPDRSGWDSRDYYDDVISELWEVLNLVEKMRLAQKEANDAIAQAEDYTEATYYINKAEELEKEVDEWFNDLNKQN